MREMAGSMAELGTIGVATADLTKEQQDRCCGPHGAGGKQPRRGGERPPECEWCDWDRSY